MVLLVGAGLLLASFYRSQTVDPGYRANHVLSAEAFTNFSKYPDIGAQLRFYQPVLEVFAALALLVTIACITGVIATSVSQRTQEFGVRIVLGASRGRTSSTPRQPIPAYAPSDYKIRAGAVDASSPQSVTSGESQSEQ